MKFYWREVEQELVDRICNGFAWRSFFWSVGDGYRNPSAFDLMLGQLHTGTCLI